MDINLDMDGVLANFVDAALKIHGKYDFKVTNWNFFEEWGITEEEFWAPIHAMGAEFWENLEPYAWARELVELVKTYDEDFVVLTKPSKHESCQIGKQRWMDRYFPGVPVVFSQNKSQDRCKGSHCVLIDDSDKNCDEWWRTGGSWVVFPQPWNELGSLCKSHPMDCVVDRIEGLAVALAKPGEPVRVRDIRKTFPGVSEGEMVVNERGGKQSFVPARIDLIPPKNLLLLGECLGFGARKYGENNWHNITVEENLNHLMVHAVKWLAGDRSEPHLVNILARGNFALWHAVESGEQPEKYIHPDMVKEK